MTELEKCELAKAKGFTYCPLSGSIRGVRGNVMRKKNKGYIECYIIHDRKMYNVLGHRLAWYLHYGKLPVNFIDHKDGVKNNNTLNNLRDVTQQQNNMNNTKAKGFSWHKQHNKFLAKIQFNGKNIHLGLFNTATEARNAYLAAKEKYHLIPAV